MKHALVVAITLTLFATRAWSEEPEKAKGPMDGTWLVVGMAQRGQEVPAEHLPLGVARFEGDQATFVMWDMQSKATVTMNLDAEPTALDITHIEGTYKGQTQYAVFKRTGDEAVFCGAEPGSPPESRPTSVESAEPGHLVVRFRRIDPQAKKN
jgi:uncharacterized protein (TIGR03067 family)